MDYQEIARKELSELKVRTNLLILHMVHVASMQKLRMLQEFKNQLNGFEVTVMKLAKEADGGCEGQEGCIPAAGLAVKES